MLCQTSGKLIRLTLILLTTFQFAFTSLVRCLLSMWALSKQRAGNQFHLADGGERAGLQMGEEQESESLQLQSRFVLNNPVAKSKSAMY